MQRYALMTHATGKEPRDMRTVTVNGRSIDLSVMYRDSGRELVLFLHGLGCAKESFEDAWGFRGLSRYSLLSPDMVGFGDSGRPLSFSYSLEDQAAACASLLEICPLKEVHIVAHSMGTIVGLFLAARIPERLLSFTSVEGVLLPSPGEAAYGNDRSAYRAFRRRIAVLTRPAYGEAGERGPGLWAQWSEKASPRAFNASTAAMAASTAGGRMLSMFLRLPCPRAFVYGEKNSHLPVLDMIAGVRKASIPGSGHFPMNDNPAAFYRVIAGLLAMAQ